MKSYIIDILKLFWFVGVPFVLCPMIAFHSSGEILNNHIILAFLDMGIVIALVGMVVSTCFMLPKVEDGKVVASE